MKRWAALSLALLTLGAAPRSGFETMTPELRAMQQDEMANPGMLWVAEGEALWQRQGCANCHSLPSMAGVAARYPVFSPAHNGPIDLTGRIAECREQRQGAAPLPPEGPEMLALTAFIGRQSHGMPLAPDADPRLDPAFRQGEALFNQRRGQLNLSCAQCHEDNAGRSLAGSSIPEGHGNGYPQYRLEWQGLGSLQRRLRNCLAGVRSEPFPPRAPEYLAIEVFLARRARGLTVETPAIRP